MNSRFFQKVQDLEARIRNYELAARMQRGAEAVLDIRRESAATRTLYGLDHEATENFGTRCLLARRLVEAGVRFMQVMVPINVGRCAVGPPQRIEEGA